MRIRYLRPSLTPRATLVLGAVAIAAVGSAAWPGAARIILWNTTPSEPQGLYIRTHQPPAAGRLAAFPAPRAAFPYAEVKLGYLHGVPVLKTLAAGPGDRVCTLTDHVVINGIERPAIIAEHDREGRGLPHWRACRVLGRDEFFALSDRAPNSFDSRYFGPVFRAAIIGIYQPLWLSKGER
jgi:conjugative transfer signal peptidase TraF